jgi:phospholipid transport system substrate-binding protein
MSDAVRSFNLSSGSSGGTSRRRIYKMEHARRHMAAAALSLIFVLQPRLSHAETQQEAPIVNLDNALIATMKSGTTGASFESRYEVLKPVLESAYDIPAVLEDSVGLSWATLPVIQRDELENVFEQYIVASYIKGYSLYQGQKLEILPMERHVGKTVIVDTQIVPSNGDAPIQIDYVLTQNSNQWKIIDVLLGGTISKVAVESSDFSSLVSDGDASKLISALQAKVISLSGDASINERQVVAATGS